MVIQETKEYDVIDGNVRKRAKLYFEEGDPSYVRLAFEDFDSGLIEGQSLYSAMQALHKLLDKKKVKLLCNCFLIDVRPSGMSISMGGGRKAYKLVLGKQATDLVDILDPVAEPDLIVTFDQQKEYYDKWISILKNRSNYSG